MGTQRGKRRSIQRFKHESCNKAHGHGEIEKVRQKYWTFGAGIRRGKKQIKRGPQTLKIPTVGSNISKGKRIQLRRQKIGERGEGWGPGVHTSKKKGVHSNVVLLLPMTYRLRGHGGDPGFRRNPTKKEKESCN